MAQGLLGSTAPTIQVFGAQPVAVLKKNQTAATEKTPTLNCFINKRPNSWLDNLLPFKLLYERKLQA